MRKQKAVLESIESDRPVTKEQDGAFWEEVQHALLLALKETGTLNDLQLRYAEKKLTKGAV